MKIPDLAKHKQVLIASVISVGLITALATFASNGPQHGIDPNCLPTAKPSSKPSHQPSPYPSHSPKVKTSPSPSCPPSTSPSANPSYQPTNSPSAKPTPQPTPSPTPPPPTSWSAAGRDHRYCFALNRNSPCLTIRDRKSVFNYKNYEVGFNTNLLEAGTYNLKIDYRNGLMARGYKMPKNYKYKVKVVVNNKVVKTVQLSSNQKGANNQSYVLKNVKLPRGASTVTLVWTNDYWVKNKYDANFEVLNLSLKK